MANTFKWSVQKLRVAPQQDGKTNIVVQADWLCVAISEENIVQAGASGSKSFTLGDSFAAFDQLTEAQVLDWCFAPETITETDRKGNVTTNVKNLKTDAEKQVTGQIERQLVQNAAEPALPWL
tara:strand:- start:45 stop:413 length:369 start_codon:yes stop_codon:yes gene_type:complete